MTSVSTDAPAPKSRSLSPPLPVIVDRFQRYRRHIATPTYFRVRIGDDFVRVVERDMTDYRRFQRACTAQGVYFWIRDAEGRGTMARHFWLTTIAAAVADYDAMVGHTTRYLEPDECL